MVRWVRTRKGLTRWHGRSTFAGIPDSPSISAAWPRTRSMVETMGFAWEIVTARSGKIKQVLNEIKFNVDFTRFVIVIQKVG